MIAVNLKGPIACVRAVLDSMIERRTGKIVSISSDAGRVGSSGEAVYAGAKAGIIGFSKTLEREVARYSINVNVVCPGPTNTPLFREISGGNEKLDRLAQAGDPARPPRRTRRTWPAPSRSSPPTTPPSSPARRSR